MRVPLTSLLSYYRNSLADADRMLPEENLLFSATQIDAQEWLSGQLEPESMADIWNIRSVNGRIETDEWGRKRFWFCPWVGTLKPEHGATRSGLPSRVIPLWIPIRLSENGTVEPDPTLLPWIPRNLLEPIYPARLVLGTVDDVDTYLAANIWEDPEALENEQPSDHRKRRMQAWMQYGANLVSYVTKKDWSVFALEEYYTEPSSMILPAGAPSAKISGLLSHYDALIRDKITTPPLQRFINGDVFPTIDPMASNEDPRALHIAHTPGLAELSNDQRDALHKALTHQPDVLAIHGPPGTGKTKWIVELALQAYVEAALDEEPNPPIQLWVAGTNQAIFSSLATLQNGITGARWAYPDIRGLGIWCAAKSQQRENLQSEHDWLGFKWQDGLPEGSPALWGSEDAVIEAIQNYEYAAQKHFGERMELSAVKQRVLNEIRKNAQPLRTTWRLLKRDRIRKQNTDKLLVESQWPTEFEEFARHTQTLINRRKLARERANYIYEEWIEHVNNTPIWIMLTASLPGAANRYLTRNKNFFARFNMIPKGANLKDNDSVTKTLQKLVRTVDALCEETEKQWSEVRRIRQEKDEIAKAWSQLSDTWHETPRWYDDGTIDSNWEVRCDTIYRQNATIWALRYWEAVFLEKRLQYYKDGRSNRMRSKFDGWRELACLTPMLGTTMHTAPRYFHEGTDDRDMRPMYGFAHRLVIEESSQLAPDAITGMLSYARSAVFVGDEKQLRPIYSVPEKTDIGNLIQHGLMDYAEQVNDWRDSELMASCGSALLRAKQAGLNVYLKEQHRSHPDLVAFANRLCYNESIIPIRTDNDPDWPAFSYGHIIGVPENQHASKCNRVEAAAIAQYLLKMAPVIKAKYNVRRLGDALGIVTPFLRQVQILKLELMRRLPSEDIPHVGTVHSYQGAEKPIMLFSAVQAVNGVEIPFFDIDTTMLNVAVSRAKDAFWYIGNMNGMQLRGLRPSAILAQFLIKGSYQRLNNWALPSETPHNLRLSQPLSFDEQERLKVFYDFLQNTPSGPLHIAAPTVHPEYLEKIQFWQHARAANQRGVHIIIHANKTLLTYYGDSRASDFVRTAGSYGITVQYHAALFDCRIWTPNRMAESSSSWLSPLNGGNFALYDGAVQVWCQAQASGWSPLAKSHTFGQKIDDASTN